MMASKILRSIADSGRKVNARLQRSGFAGANVLLGVDHALLRAAAHFEVDLIGSRLSIPIDRSTFTDRDRKGARKLAPSELDVIAGLTST